MDNLYEELDDAKAEIEKLKAEVSCKAELCESLRRSQNVQIGEVREARCKIEKLDQELNQKAEEAFEAKKMVEDLKMSLNEKESVVKRLSAANDKLRVDCDDKIKKWEDEHKGLLLALEEANTKAGNQEQQILVQREEIERLKGCLLISKKKCLEVEKQAKNLEQQSERDDMYDRLEDESRKFEDQLKWKKEQFKHLEEAHERLRAQFRSSQEEWEKEKFTLFDEISLLQTKLDSQIRISEDLQYQLQMSNQALAHEESRRKHLEVQVSDLKSRYENTFTECQNAKSQLENLSSLQDKDIADLRQLLKTKEAYYKELKYQIAKLEQENQELHVSLKELQEAKIQESGTSSSMSKLRNKLRGLEKIQKSCAENIQAKEAEWSRQLEKLTSDLNCCQDDSRRQTEALEELKRELESCQESKIQLMVKNEEMCIMLRNKLRSLEEIQKSCAENVQAKEAKWSRQLEKLTSDLNCCRDDSRRKTAVMEELKRELESCQESNIQLMMKNEEMCIMLLVLRLGISGTQLKLHDKEKEEEIAELISQLAMKDAALDRFRRDNQREKKKIVDLTSKVEELNKFNASLEEKAFQVESDYKEILREVSDALDRTNIELDESICERKEMEFELQTWKLIADRMKNDLEENQAIRKELETSLLAQIDVGEALKEEKDVLLRISEDKDGKISDLEQQVELFGQQIKDISTDRAISSEQERVRYNQITREKDLILEELNEEIDWLEQESFRREVECILITQSSLESSFKHEEQNLIKLVEGKNMRLDAITNQLKSLEEQFNCSMVSFSSQLAEKQVELNLVYEAWEEIKAAEILSVLEIEEKKFMITELENDIHDLQEKIKLQEEAWYHSEQHVVKIEAELKAKQSELKALRNQLENNVESPDSLLQRLKTENRNLVRDFTKLSTEREQLFDFIMDLDDKIRELCTSDAQSLNSLTRMVQSFENGFPEIVLNENEAELLVKENAYVHSPSGMKKTEVNFDTTRSPFRELNS